MTEAETLYDSNITEEAEIENQFEEEMETIEDVTTEEMENAEEDVSRDTDNIVRDYFMMVKAYPPMTREEETTLAKRVSEGSKSAREEMINRNLRLVISIAKRYINKGVPFMDLIQEGNVGLIKAVDRYDYTRGYKFSTYGIWWIQQSIVKAIEDKNLIHIPQQTVNKYNSAAETVNQTEIGNTPKATAKIAEEMNTSEAHVNQIENALGAIISLDAVTGSGESSVQVMDFVSDDGNRANIEGTVDRIIAKEVFSAALGTLEFKERCMLKMRYGLVDGRSHTLDEVGKEFNVTRERIRQLEERTFKKLRTIENIQELMQPARMHATNMAQ